MKNCLATLLQNELTTMLRVYHPRINLSCGKLGSEKLLNNYRRVKSVVLYMLVNVARFTGPTVT